MMDSVFLVSSIREKHRKAPLLLERERYLAYLFEIGTRRERVRYVATMLLHIVRLLELDAPRLVGIDEILKGSQRWVNDPGAHRHRSAAEASAYTFQLVATNWLRFQGSLIVVPKPKPYFHNLLSQFLNDMHTQRGLALDTIRSYRSRVLTFLNWLQPRCTEFSSVRPLDIEEFLEAKRSDGWARSSVAAHCHALRTFFGYKPEQTAQVAQRLFEEGLITYLRTDSQNFSTEALAEIRAYAGSNNLPLPPKARTWKSKESAQEAHEAIRPTHLEQRNAWADDDQRKLYDLIWTRAVASQLADAEYSVNTVTLAAQDGSQPFVFKAMGRTLIKPGWRTLTAKDAAEEPDPNDADDSEKQSDEYGRVPALGRGTQIRADSARVLNKQTRPPNGYTQASLIKKLEHEGISRPSTYPTILKNIITRNYIDDSKKIMRATDLGILLIDALKGHFAFLEYDYTRSLEQQLDDIAEGKAQYLNVVSSIDGQLKKELAQLYIAPLTALASNGSAPAKTGAALPPGPLVCPKCKQGTVKKPNGQNFYGCSRYREGCNFSISETIAKKTLTPKQIETLCAKGKTALLKGFISKQGKPFEAYLSLGEETDWKAQFRFESSH